MPFNVKAARLETFHEACQGRTLTFEAALASDDLELVDAAAWACPLDLLLPTAATDLLVDVGEEPPQAVSHEQRVAFDEALRLARHK